MSLLKSQLNEICELDFYRKDLLETHIGTISQDPGIQYKETKIFAHLEKF